MTNNFKLILDLHRAKFLVVLTGIYILAETLRFDLLTYTIVSYLILVLGAISLILTYFISKSSSFNSKESSIKEYFYCIIALFISMVYIYMINADFYNKEYMGVLANSLAIAVVVEFIGNIMINRALANREV